MIISDKFKFICLNPPKTGSGTREALLEEFASIAVNLTDIKNFQRHASYDQMIKFCSEHKIPHEEYFKFTFVRNPWRRIESWYCMKVVQQKLEPTQDEFIKFVQEREKQHMCCWQDCFFFQKDIDYIGTTETMYEDLSKIWVHLGLPKPNREEYHGLMPQCVKDLIKTLWTDELIEFVADKEKEVIKLKGYTYE